MTANNNTKLLTEDQVQSQTIYFLRFVLIIGVVFGHAYLVSPWDSYQGPYSLFIYIFIRIFQRMPILVLFSGFLFFRSGFSMRIYGKKLKSRVKSLLVPYLCWNAVAVLFYLFLQFFLLHQGRTPNDKLIVDYGWRDWLQAFGFSQSLPMAQQFWFIRNLMMLMILSPIFYLLVRYLKFFGVVLSCLPWILIKFTGVSSLWGIEMYSLFFFALGAWFALRNQNFVQILMPHRIWTGILFVVLAVWNAYDYAHGKTFSDIISKISLLFSIVAIIGFTGSFIASGRLKVNVALCQSSFFIFALHMIPVDLLRSFLCTLIPPSEWGFLFIHLFSTTVVVLFCIGVYKLMHRFTPKFLSVITGGR